MIKRLYIHNFRCLENFDLPISGQPSSLLIGKNGAGKSTVGDALQVLQQIARGTNRVRELVSEKDFTRGRKDVPIRFELEVVIRGDTFLYSLALELPSSFKEMRVAEETLSYNAADVFSRSTSQVTLSRTTTPEARFIVDWHLVALPVIQVQSDTDPIHLFKTWLASMLILAPIPSQIKGESEDDTLMPNKNCLNFGAWFTGLLSHSPSAYSHIDEFVRQVLPDFKDIKNPIIAKNARSLSVQFQQDDAVLKLAFDDLSDGEKCFFICAVVIASNEAYGPIFCFWDEPDNYLSLEETGQFVMDLRRSFKLGGQLLITSHNPEAIRRFSAENTLLLDRKTHFEPTVVRALTEVTFDGNLVDALIRGDVEA